MRDGFKIRVGGRYCTSVIPILLILLIAVADTASLFAEGKGGLAPEVKTEDSAVLKYKLSPGTELIYEIQATDRWQTETTVLFETVTKGTMILLPARQNPESGTILLGKFFHTETVFPVSHALPSTDPVRQSERLATVLRVDILGNSQEPFIQAQDDADTMERFYKQMHGGYAVDFVPLPPDQQGEKKAWTVTCNLPEFPVIRRANCSLEGVKVVEGKRLAVIRGELIQPEDPLLQTQKNLKGGFVLLFDVGQGRAEKLDFHATTTETYDGKPCTREINLSRQFLASREIETDLLEKLPSQLQTFEQAKAARWAADDPGRALEILKPLAREAIEAAQAARWAPHDPGRAPEILTPVMPEVLKEAVLEAIRGAQMTLEMDKIRKQRTTQDD